VTRICTALLAGWIALASFAPIAQAGDGAPHDPNGAATPGHAGNFKGTVVSTIQADRYTYVEFNTGDEVVWAAVPSQEMKAGDTIYLSSEMPMRDFYSKTLDRRFELIYFTGAVKVVGADDPKPGAAEGSSTDLPPGHP
jgi:hypothetical protein